LSPAAPRGLDERSSKRFWRRGQGSLFARATAPKSHKCKPISAGGAKVRGHALDVSDGDLLKAWVAEVNAEFGGINIVVANVSALAISHDEAAWRNGVRGGLDGHGPFG
jgi:NAD(P)-dependent dehydrogenase (short-subunit alcohol dehydrogenase family)